MKRILKSIAVLAVSALAMVSCQKELLGPAVQEGQEVAVSIDLTTPLMGTKAYADGQTVDVVHVHVYQQDSERNLTYIAPNATTATPSKDVTMTGGTASYSTRLVTGQKYTFVFWAEKKSDNSPYSYDDANQTITVDYSNAAGNDESRDAFYAVLPNVPITGAYSASVELHRPFAQLNFGASDYEDAKAAGIEVTGAAVKLTNVANTLNLLTGEVDGDVEVEFASTTLPNDPDNFTVAGVNYKYVAMDYVLVGKGAKTLSDVTLTLDVQGTTSTTPKYTYTNVPLQGNYRTNIVGSLFTSPADINITVDPNFNEPAETIVTGVANMEGANAAFANGATEVVVEEIVSDDPNEIILPATTAAVSLTLPAAPDGKTITIKYPVSASEVPANLTIKAVNAESLTIEAPRTHVELNGITVTSLTASTSNTTLVVGKDVTIKTLTLNAGNAVIYGNVTSKIVRGESNPDAYIEYHVYDKSALKKAVGSQKANYVILENDIVFNDYTSGLDIDLMSKSLTAPEITVDLNGHSISKNGGSILKLSKGTISFVGSGYIENYMPFIISGSKTSTDESYSVLNIGPDVTVKANVGILIDKPGSSYTKYGIVVNCQNTFEITDGGMAATINGNNTVTEGKVPKFNFSGATIRGGGLGIYAAGYAEWNLTNTTIDSQLSALEVRAGKVTFNGGEYKSTNSPFSIAANGSGTTISGAALGISQHTTDLPIDVVVNDGTFTGQYAIYEEDVQNSTARENIKLTVNGGTFNGAIYSQNNQNCLLAGSYDDASALDYMGNYNGDINITMARDGSICTSNFYLNRGGANTSTITLDGNGHSLTFHSSYRNHIQTSNVAKVIIKNATVDSDYKVGGSTWDDYGLIFQCPTEFENVTFNRQLVLEDPYVHKLTNVKINQTSATGDMYALWICAGADVTVNGGVITAVSPNGNKNRAIKIADEYVSDPQLTKLSVSGVTFKSDKKAAVLVTSTAGANIVWGERNDISEVAADQTNAVWNDADRAAAWDFVTVTGCTKYQEQ
ncbi:MAG: hypothetical protein PUC96_00485 [Bacteroidales bacterium]|nr:hypothetical protein [Bacteroidales bacterium]